MTKIVSLFLLLALSACGVYDNRNIESAPNTLITTEAEARAALRQTVTKEGE